MTKKSMKISSIIVLALLSSGIANYKDSTRPVGTTIVGSVGSADGYGYGVSDMAGNVHEWTSSDYGSTTLRLFRGGSLDCRDDSDDLCTVSNRLANDPFYTSYDVGFRVCR
jgi:formylglycine-generating enzyme required for sulfatase activity